MVFLVVFVALGAFDQCTSNGFMQFNICFAFPTYRVSLSLCVYCQSVDNELVLWEPKIKEQSPGEV